MGEQALEVGGGSGLRIRTADVDSLVKNVGTELKAALAQRFVKRKTTDYGSYDIHYFTTVPPVSVPAGQESIPCIPIAIKTFPKMWIAVELRIARTGDRSRGEHFLEHVSIKLVHGEPLTSGEILFRAEWDARDTGMVHAQPHWNIHEEAWRPKPPASGFATFVEKEKALDFHQFGQGSRASKEPTFDHVRMHFALASTWHNATGAHSCSLENIDEVTRWIAGCCKYIRSQFTHMGQHDQ